MSTPVVIETRRLRLRPLAESDLDDLARINTDPEVVRFLGSGKAMSRADSWRQIALNRGHLELRGYAMWAIENRESGEFVGRGGPWFPEGWPMLEVGWTIDPRFRRQGLATEAARAALDWCFEELDARQVCSLIRPDNLASARVAEKLGARIGYQLDEFFGGVANVWIHERPAR